MLKDLAASDRWRELYGSASSRGKDQELILRFFAVYFDLANYERPLKQFLNKFMNRNRNLKVIDDATLRKTFSDAVAYAVGTLGPKAFRPVRNLNTALTEAVLIGTGKRLEKGPIREPDSYRAAFRELMADGKFVESFNGATTDVERLKFRVKCAIDAFGTST